MNIMKKLVTINIYFANPKISINKINIIEKLKNF